MTGRERILAAFRGESVDRVPFAPNIYQWFYYHLINHSLPAELAQAEHPFDVLRYLEADILARWDTQWATKAVYTDGEYSEEYVGHTDWDKPMVTAFNIYPPPHHRAPPQICYTLRRADPDLDLYSGSRGRL